MYFVNTDEMKMLSWFTSRLAVKTFMETGQRISLADCNIEARTIPEEVIDSNITALKHFLDDDAWQTFQSAGERRQCYCSVSYHSYVETVSKPVNSYIINKKIMNTINNSVSIACETEY